MNEQFLGDSVGPLNCLDPTFSHVDYVVAADNHFSSLVTCDKVLAEFFVVFIAFIKQTETSIDQCVGLALDLTPLPFGFGNLNVAQSFTVSDYNEVLIRA